MPAVAEEIDEAISEGIKINYLTNPLEFIGNGAINTLKVIEMELGDADES